MLPHQIKIILNLTEHWKPKRNKQELDNYSIKYHKPQVYNAYEEISHNTTLRPIKFNKAERESRQF